MASFDQPADRTIPPSSWVVRFSPLIRPGGTVLDVAAGHGRHTNFFLEHHFNVTAVDVDASHLKVAQNRGASVLEADLEDGPWPFAPNAYDAIVVANYLHRPHFPKLIESLALNGVLMIDTFGAGNETIGRPRNPDFLLAPGELLSAFGAPLRIVAYEHGREEVPRPAVRQRLCAQKLAHSDMINTLPAPSPTG